MPEGTPQPSWIFPRRSGGFWRGSCTQAMLNTLSLWFGAGSIPKASGSPGEFAQAQPTWEHAPRAPGSGKLGRGGGSRHVPQLSPGFYFPHSERGTPGLSPSQPHHFSL